ncbi:ECF transporter S component [Thomasclavelia sp.]
MKSEKTRKLVLMAVLSALSAVLMVFRFPLPFMPPFLSFDFAGIPELIGAFTLGPVSGIFIIVVRVFLQLALAGTNSMFTGELQSLMLSLALVLPASLIYKKSKTKQGAIKGMVVGSFMNVIIAVFTNLIIIIPFYISLYGMDMKMIIEMSKVVNPYVDSTLKLVLLGIVPFNLIKNIIVCLITFLIYKKISPIIKRYTK